MVDALDMVAFYLGLVMDGSSLLHDAHSCPLHEDAFVCILHGSPL